MKLFLFTEEEVREFRIVVLVYAGIGLIAALIASWHKYYGIMVPVSTIGLFFWCLGTCLYDYSSSRSYYVL